MTTDAEAADNTSLTVNQAVAELEAAEKKEEAAPAEAEAPPETETEASPEAEEASGPETAAADDNAETEEAIAEGEEPQQPALDPPNFWAAEDREAFGKMSRADQERVRKYEALGNKATAEAIEKAAVARKTAEAETSRTAQLNGILDKVLPEATETFKSRWEGVDWDQVVRERGADQAFLLQNQMNRERELVQRLQIAKNEADQIQFKQFVAQQEARIPEFVPDLADPAHGKERRDALGKYLIDGMTKAGEDINAIPRMTAWQASVAYKAMKWDQAEAQARNAVNNPKSQAKPAAQPAKPSVKATAAPASSASRQSATIKALEGRFAADPSIKNLEALMEAKGI